MISKVIRGSSFYGVCKYICEDEKRAVVLETEGVRSYHFKQMAADFETQHALRPSLKKAVFHGILSFYPGEKPEDATMIEIAKEYLQKAGITETQYAIAKHTDRNHLHLHIIANMVNNKGEAIRDNWIGLKAKKVSQELTLKYGLKEAVSKNLSLTNLERLNEKEANRYVIYKAILEKLPLSKDVDNLKARLQKEGIETLYKYKGQTDELQGISFKIGDFKYKGSEVDRNFSLKNLERTIQQQAKVNELLPQTSTSSASRKLSNINADDLQNDSIKNRQRDSNPLVEELIKPEQINEQLPYELRKKRRQKKRQRRL